MREDRFRKLCWDGFIEFVGTGPETAEARDRLAFEIREIERLGLADLFLLVEDVARFCRGNGILVGPGRGAACGSLSAFALGITKGNPLEHGLVFERLVNENSPVPPSLELEVCSEGMERAVAHLQEVVGSYAVAEEPCILANPGLTRLRRALKRVRKASGESVSPETIPLDDDGAWRRIAEGRAEDFDWSGSPEFAAILREARPREFRDLSSLLSLSRPGPTTQGMLVEYVARMNGKAPAGDMHPAAMAVLAETRGMLVYQESCIHLANRVGGFSLREGDDLRRAISKKKAEDVRVLRRRFEEGAASNGLSVAEAQAVFDLMERMVPFSFCKAHAVSCSLVVYWMAYLKANWGVESHAIGVVPDSP